MFQLEFQFLTVIESYSHDTSISRNFLKYFGFVFVEQTSGRWKGAFHSTFRFSNVQNIMFVQLKALIIIVLSSMATMLVCDVSAVGTDTERRCKKLLCPAAEDTSCGNIHCFMNDSTVTFEVHNFKLGKSKFQILKFVIYFSIPSDEQCALAEQKEFALAGQKESVIKDQQPITEMFNQNL